MTIQVASTSDERTVVALKRADGRLLALFAEIPDSTQRSALETRVRGLMQAEQAERYSTVRLAVEIESALASAESGRRELPEWLFFAAVCIMPECIEATFAGAHRIHVLEKGRVVHATREHVLSNEAPTYRSSLDRAEHGAIITRCLSSRRTAEFETALWARPALTYDVLVTPPDIYQGLRMSEYLHRDWMSEVGPHPFLFIRVTS